MRRAWAIAMVVVIVASIAALGGWLYSRESLFRVESIEVRLPESPLRKDIEESLLAYSGRSMFALKLGELEQALLRHPQISAARILRRWPSTLVIEAELKTKAALEFRNKTLWFVDQKGEQIAPLATAEALPLMWGFDEHTALKSDLLEWIVAARAKDEMLGNLDEIAFDHDVILGFKNVGLRVHLGTRNWPQRWARAKAAFAAMQKQGRLALVIDASVEGRVFVYDSVELHNSQSGLNLRELVRRTRENRALAR
ncbi:MAG: FtsQ-type POTRA domain-containing protein [Bdellovibrionota bacterium]